MFIASHPVTVFDHLVVASFISTLYYKHTIPSGLVFFAQVTFYLNGGVVFEICADEIVEAVPFNVDAISLDWPLSVELYPMTKRSSQLS